MQAGRSSPQMGSSSYACLRIFWWVGKKREKRLFAIGTGAVSYQVNSDSCGRMDKPALPKPVVERHRQRLPTCRDQRVRRAWLPKMSPPQRSGQSVRSPARSATQQMQAKSMNCAITAYVFCYLKYSGMVCRTSMKKTCTGRRVKRTGAGWLQPFRPGAQPLWCMAPWWPRPWPRICRCSASKVFCCSAFKAA